MNQQYIPETVKKLRQSYRADQISSRYSGRWHLSLSLIFATIMVMIGFLNIKIQFWWEWAFIPISFFIANLVEYLAHRYLLHRPGLKLAYKEHTLLHHFFFTHEAVEIESTQDFHRVLFSPYAVFFFIFIIGTPIFFLFGYLFGASIGWMSFMVGVSYYGLYETVHTCCHLPDEHWVFLIPGLRFLKNFHRIHHNQELMREYHFNVLFPLSDVLFGTYYRKR